MLAATSPLCPPSWLQSPTLERQRLLSAPSVFQQAVEDPLGQLPSSPVVCTARAVVSQSLGVHTPHFQLLMQCSRS